MLSISDYQFHLPHRMLNILASLFLHDVAHKIVFHFHPKSILSQQEALYKRNIRNSSDASGAMVLHGLQQHIFRSLLNSCYTKNKLSQYHKQNIITERRKYKYLKLVIIFSISLPEYILEPMNQFYHLLAVSNQSFYSHFWHLQTVYSLQILQQFLFQAILSCAQLQIFEVPSHPSQIFPCNTQKYKSIRIHTFQSGTCMFIINFIEFKS